jgi:tRNA pseudouridine38-40 synthase
VKKRYFIYLSYKGTAYHGWQSQPNGISVQEVLTNAVSTVLRIETEITGAGRTDTGVHARLMVAHFDSEMSHLPKNMVSRLNSILPNDIVVSGIREVKPEAHARFDAVSRRYEYVVITEKNVFEHDFAVKIADLDFGKMNEAAEILKSYTDFTSFSKLHTDVKTNNCKIYSAKWLKIDDSKWIFSIEADRFLRNMVRAVVGTLFEVGKGKLSLEQFRQIIEAKDRCKAGSSVPAKGLYLVDIKYPPEIFI